MYPVIICHDLFYDADVKPNVYLILILFFHFATGTISVSIAVVTKVVSDSVMLNQHASTLGISVKTGNSPPTGHP